MRHNLFLIAVMTLCYFVLGQADVCEARPPAALFDAGISAVGSIQNPGKAELEFFFKSEYDFGQVDFVVTTSGYLTFEGNITWKAEANHGDSITQILNVIIPPNDTSGIEVRIDKDGNPLTAGSIFFITTGNTLQVLKIDPKSQAYQLSQLPGRFENQYRGKKLPWEPPAPKPEHKVIYHAPTDREKMEQLEREPLTDSDVQHIDVDGEVWGRSRGEYKFHKIEPIRDHTAYYDSIQNELYKNTTHIKYEVILDLYKPRDYEFAKELIGEGLYETENKGFYRCSIPKLSIKKLVEFGIKITPLPQNKGNREKAIPASDSNSNANDQSSKDSEIDSESREILFNFDFESEWHSFWTCQDLNQYNGFDYWDTCTQEIVTPVSGSLAVWCAGTGDMQCGENYDIQMQAWMKSSEAYYIGGHENLTFRFYIWYETEPQYDYVMVGYSYDGGFWYTWGMVHDWSGTSGGWLYKNLDVPPGHDSIYFAFEFWSDFLDSDYRGVFIDNVQLTGQSIVPKPNLTYTTPVGWDSPIVPSPDTGTHSVGVLYGHAPTYVDLAVKNDGPVESGQFQLAFYIDSVLENTFQMSSISPGNEGLIIDHPCNIGPGAHDLTIEIDPANQVTESSENDNLYLESFNWEGAGTVKVTGTIKYLDLNNSPATSHPVRSIRVELWDEDIAFDDSLDAGWTDQFGDFTLGPVSNADELGSGRQDIFLRIYADNDAAFLNHTHDGDCHYFQTATISEVPDTNYPFGDINGGGIDNGAFYIIDKIKDGRDHWMIDLNQNDPGRVQVLLADSGTYYDHRLGQKFIQIDTSTSGYYPDIYDKDIILHEYGHRLADVFIFFSTSGGGGHYWHSKISMGLAASEGFAHFWSCQLRDSAIIKDYYHNFGYYANWNAENGEWGYDGSWQNSATDFTDTCEAAVAGMLWDLYDDVDDDYSHWTGQSGVGYQDSVGDTYNNGVYKILDCLVNRNYSSHHPDNMSQFWNVWFQTPSYGDNSKIWAIWYEHGVNMDLIPPAGAILINENDSLGTSLIVDINLNIIDTLSGLSNPRAGMRFSNDNTAWSNWEPFDSTKTGWDLSAYGGNSNFGTKVVYAKIRDATQINVTSFSDQIIYTECIPGDANGDDRVNIGDAVYIINYVFDGGLPPIPYETCSGDANGDCIADVGDAVYLIAYIFRGGSPPIDCNAWIAYCGRPIRK